MTLIARSGSLKAVSSQDDRNTPRLEQNTGFVQTDRVASTDNQLAGNDNYVDQLIHISDTYTTRSSVNPQRYNEVHKMLLAYPKGSPIVVTYFRRNEPDTDIRSIPGDISDTMHTIHKDFTEIRNFEMRLMGSLEHQKAEDDFTYNLTGEALVYPGLEPRYSDQFFLDIGDGVIGVFTVNHIEPTTYRQGAFYKINFNLNCIATKDSYDAIKNAVRDVVYFDKRKYFGESELTFLDTEGYNTLNALRQVRKQLVQTYVNQFYSEEYESFMRPDEVYDPYVTEFMRKKVTLLESKIRPLQLFTRLKDYHKCIWYKFLDAESMGDFTCLTPVYHIATHRVMAYDTDINALADRDYVKLGYDPIDVVDTEKKFKKSHPYVFSQPFYDNNKDPLPDFEAFVYDYLTTRQISISKVAEYVKNYRTLNEMQAFYSIPMYVELTDVAIQSIR